MMIFLIQKYSTYILFIEPHFDTIALKLFKLLPKLSQSLKLSQPSSKIKVFKVEESKRRNLKELTTTLIETLASQACSYKCECEFWVDIGSQNPHRQVIEVR